MNLMDKRGVPLEVGQTVAAATLSYKQARLRLGKIERVNPETRKVTIRTGLMKFDCSVVNVASPGHNTSTILVIESLQENPEVTAAWAALNAELDAMDG